MQIARSAEDDGSATERGAGPNTRTVEHAPRPLRTFLRPRFLSTWIAVAFMWSSAQLPAGLTLAVYRIAGRLLHAVSPRQSRVAHKNLELCFPEMSKQERRALVARHFEALGMSFVECARGWFASDRQIAPQFAIEGVEHLHEALARGKGVILYTGHFTPLELCGRPVKQLVPHFACMFSRRSNDLLDEIQRRGRDKIAHESIPRDNVRAMLRSLAANAVVWYAPDQAHRNGVLLPFFGEPALMNVATSRLARVSGAAVVPFSYARRGNTPFYDIRFDPAVRDFPTDDVREDTRRLIAILESSIRQHPEQYLWTQKKFSGRPPPYENPYHEPR